MAIVHVELTDEQRDIFREDYGEYRQDKFKKSSEHEKIMRVYDHLVLACYDEELEFRIRDLLIEKYFELTI